MRTQQIKHNLIEKIMFSKNYDLLIEIDKILDNTIKYKKSIKLSEEQIKMLRNSEKDIHEGNIIPDELINKEEDKWLNK